MKRNIEKAIERGKDKGAKLTFDECMEIVRLSKADNETDTILNSIQAAYFAGLGARK